MWQLLYLQESGFLAQARNLSFGPEADPGAATGLHFVGVIPLACNIDSQTFGRKSQEPIFFDMAYDIKKAGLIFEEQRRNRLGTKSAL